MKANQGRQSPRDLNAEAAVLSAMMVDTYAMARAVEMLNDEHFDSSVHKKVFRSLVELFEKNIEIDLITLIDKLREKNWLEDVGGEAFINDLSDIVMSGGNIEYHAKIVLDRALLRELIVASQKIIEECYKSDFPVEEIVDEAEQSIFKVAERPGTQSFVKINDIIPETLKSIEEIAQTKKSYSGVPTGFPDLDRRIGGFRAGQLIVIAARPAMGKTSFALNIAFNAAMYHDKKVGIFTMEMEGQELLMRLISSASEVSMDSMLKGYGINEKKILRITQVAEALSEKDIYIDDNGANTILDIRAKTRRLQSKLKGLDMIIIDYMQLMSVKRNRENRQQEISEISRSLKILAKELSLPVIALSQLNRGVESRDDKRPKLSDLRESGAIEQDADLVMFIYRDIVYNEDSEMKNVAEIIIGKNRHGALGKTELMFQGECTAFRSLSHE